MTKIIGESFKPWVREQIKTRQKRLANKNKTDDVLRYTNNRGTFIRLTSGVDINGSNDLAVAGMLLGGDIAARSNEGAGDVIGRTYIKSFNSYWSDDQKFGFVPPPGIVSAEVRPLEMGQIREANIQIVCHSLQQFEVIEQLYLRLKYSILLEWGHTTYFNNSDKYVSNAPIQNALQDLFLKSNNHLEFLRKIEEKRKESSGNYDAFLGFVTNFEWTLRTDGGYDISLRAYSLGDVIESLKLNTNFPNPRKKWKDEDTNDFITLNRDRSTLHYILYSLKKEIDTQASGRTIYALNGYNAGSQSSIHTNEIKRITGLKVNYIDPQEKWNAANNILTDQELVVNYFPNLSNSINGKQYFIKLGALLRIMNNFLLLYNSVNKKTPLIQINYDYDKNLCLTLPRQSSVDPRVCVLDLPEFADKTIKSNPYDEVYEIKYRYTEFIDTSTAAASYPGGGSIGGTYEFSSDLDQLIDRYNTIKVTRAQLDQSGYKLGTNEYNFDDNTFINQLQQASKDEPSTLPAVSALSKDDVKDQENGNFIVPGVVVHIAAEGYHNDTYPKANYYISIDDVIVTDVSYAPSVFDNSQSQYASHFCEPTPPFNNIQFYRKFRVNKKEYIGKPMHILVNIQCIIDILNSISDINENSEVSVYEFLDTLMQKIQSALGNINHFKIVYDEVTNVFNIVDMTLLPGGLSYLGLENIVSRFHLNTLNNKEGSFVQNFSLKTEITNDLATNIVVGAQGQGNQVGFNATAFSKWNLNLTDRIIKEKANTNTPNYNTINTSNNPFEEYRNNLSKYYLLLYKISKGDVTDEEINTYKGVLADILNYEMGYHTNNGDISGTGFIPLNLQLEMDGLSGMRIYETYNVEETLLPKSYKNNLEFITTTLSHKIDNKGWITTINGIGSPKYAAAPKYNPPTVVLLDGCPIQPPPPPPPSPPGNGSSGGGFQGGDKYLTGTEPQFAPMVPRSILLHYTDGNTKGKAIDTVSYAMSKNHPRRGELPSFGIHYCVDGYGNVASGVPEDRQCMHGDNHRKVSIGIEMNLKGRLKRDKNTGEIRDTNGRLVTEKDILPGNKFIDLGYTYEGYRWYIEFTDEQIAAAKKLIMDIMSRHPTIKAAMIGQSVWSVFGLPGRPAPESNVKGYDYTTYNTPPGIYSHNTGNGTHVDTFPSPKLIQMLLELGLIS